MGQEGLADVAFRGDLERVKGMIMLGSDPDARNERGYSPLHAAINGGHVEIVRYLLECGVDANGEDSRGWTPIFRTIAVESDAAEQCTVAVPRTDILELLLEFGADPNLVSSSVGVPRAWERTPLQLARGFENKHAEAILLNAGANA